MPVFASNDLFDTDQDTPISGNVFEDNGAGADEGAALTIAAINGVAAEVGTQVLLPSGALVTLNPDGTFDYDPNGAFDSLGDGALGTDSFEYTVRDATLDLSLLDSSDGFRIVGLSAGDNLGFSVSSAGDVNGDGIADLIIGAPGVDVDGVRSVGESYVVFGSETGFPDVLDLSTLDGTNGFVLEGVGWIDLGTFIVRDSGYSVSSAGDVNGDGIDDLIIGTPNTQAYDPEGTWLSDTSSGRSYVVFGSSEGFPPSLDLSTLDGSNGFVIRPTTLGGDPHSGTSVSSAGDVNGDGIDDLIVGAPVAFLDSGVSAVIFGSAAGFPAVLNLGDLDGSNGFIIEGGPVAGASGTSVSSAGDINGDGIDDLIIGAPQAFPPSGASFGGASYVLFGSADGFEATVDLDSLDGSNGFVIGGPNDSQSGRSVSSAGDVNGDGIDDLIIGAPYADWSGASYVVFGSRDGFSAELDLETLDGSNGFVIGGSDYDERLGYSVSSAGDVNGDGIDDLIVGAPNDGPNGTSYVVFGSSAGFSAVLDVTLLDGSNGFAITGSSEGGRSGHSVSAAGDVNGDGIDDLIIGAPFGENRAGEAYVIYGRPDFSPLIDTATVTIEIAGTNDAPTGGVSITGTAEQNATLTAVSTLADADGLGPLAYQWLRDGAEIPGATSETYTLTQADVGAEVSVRVTYTDQGGTAEAATSAPTTAVANVNDAPQGSVTILGDAIERQTLTAQVQITDADGLGVLAYQWLRGSEVILGATSETYLLRSEDIGERISVRVTYTDGQGTFESVTSGATPPVEWFDPALMLIGTAENDSLDGAEGNDTAFADAGNDTVQGMAGDDELRGGSGNDLIFGGLGEDSLYGGNDFDTLHGGDGNDSVWGGNGRDLAYLGNGADVFIDNAQGGVLGQDTAFGGAGSDTLLGGGGNDEFHGQAGADLLFGGLGDDRLYGGSDFDTLHGGDGNDNAWGGNGRDLAYLGNGADVFFDNLQGGVLGQDTAYGGAGNDTLRGGGGNDEYHGEEGADLVYGGLGDDRLYGGSEFDTLHGGDGNDSVWGGNGRDLAYLGNGADVFFDNSQGGVLGQDTAFGGGGNDTFRGDGGNDEFHGQAGADLLFGGFGDDLLFGGTDFDTLHGGDGNDSAWGGNGRDMAYLGNGADVFFDNGQGGVLGRDTVFGGAGNDTLRGGGGNDELHGDGGNDLIFGGLGDDWLNGGSGNDTLIGGLGADTFEFNAGFGFDVINGYDTGTDMLRLDSALWQGNRSAAQVVNDFASVTGGGVVFDFGSHVFVLNGVTTLAGLENDLVIV